MAGQMSFSNASIPITSVINSINTVKFGGLDLQPSYQRGFVWKDDFKDKLIYSIVKSYPTGNISVRVLSEANARGARSEVVDGQQRLTTIRDFVTNNYVVKSEWSRRIIEEIQLYFQNAKATDPALDRLLQKLSNKGNPRLKYSDLPEIIQGNINSYNIPMTYIADATEEQVREYFRFLQNQERLRAGEIINSIPPTHLEKYINDIENKNHFLDIIGFEDNRAEFDKIFYSIIGLFDMKIQFGSTDKAIQYYSSKAQEPSVGAESTSRMVKQINSIQQCEKRVTSGTRKRFLKYLLLLAGLGYVDFSIDTVKKLTRLKDIDDGLSVFFSAKANAVEDQYRNIDREIVEEMRYIALLTKGGHSITRVDNRMKILAHHINSKKIYETPSDIALSDE